MRKLTEKSDKNILYNRELSWLSFNERVLQEAADETVPLLQRLRFLGIYSNNLDEFVKVRVANLERMGSLKFKKSKLLSGNYTPAELLTRVSEKIRNLQTVYENTYRDILAQMQERGIRVIDEKQLSPEQESFCREYFASKVSPRIVPLMLRKSTKIPFLEDGRLYHAVKMRSDDSAHRYAVVEVPVNSSSPRFVVLPSPDASTYIIFIDDIVRLCLDEIFFMFDFDEISAYAFKFTRDAELDLDDDISKSLMQKMEQGLDNRLHGRTVRMVYDSKIPQDLLDTLSKKLGLRDPKNINPGGRYHLLRDLMRFPKVKPELEEVVQPPVRHPSIKPFSSILDVIRREDILLNYPYHTFNHLIDFLRESAVDPHVNSIFITLYRTAENSRIVNALVNAAKNGKKVTVLLELMARFDEERNILSSQMLQDAGVRVIHGTEGVKVHSKLILVRRREGSKLRGYIHLGTGNFNEDTAKVYSDLSLLTSNETLVAEAQAVCDSLLNNHKRFDYKHLMVAPHSMRSFIEKLIEKEIKNAAKGKEAHIYAKFNSLTDEKLIDSFYRASAAGVKIRLIVRGACCLKPQVEGLSDNIEAISIVDKYLEHSRIMIFANGGNEKTYISSADFMSRNLDRRVEIGAPILDKKLRETIKEIFMIQWHDNVKARNLSTFAVNRPADDQSGWQHRSQTELYDYWVSKV